MSAEPSTDLVPFRWPSGWTSPELFALVKSGPVNCLVCDTAAAGQPVAEAARRAGLAVRDFDSLAAAPLARLNWATPAPIMTIAEAVWPRVKPGGDSRAAEMAGPTGAPWIDSNSWMARLAAARAPGSRIWLDFAPPQDVVLDQAAYRLAIADAEAAGARWIVTLDSRLASGLAAGNGEARKIWGGLLSTLAFFEEHRAWKAYRHAGPLGIVSTFAGDNEFLGTEVLNLAARRNLLYRIFDRSKADSADFTGLRAVLYVDSEQPAAQLRDKLAAFARGGGLLIVPRALDSVFKGERLLDCAVSGYDLRSLGKGSVAAARQDWDDPYFLAADAHDLVSRRYDPVRLFNAGSLWVHDSVAPGGRGSLVQLVSFTSRPANSIVIRFRNPHRSVAMHTLESRVPAILPPVEVDKNAEYHLPPFSTYTALEVRA
jgi:hypothetical protein